MKNKLIFVLIPIFFAGMLISISLAYSYQAQASALAPDLGSTTTFTVNPITSNELSDTDPSVAVDINGHLHVAYVGAGTVRYQTNSSGTWMVTTVGNGTDESHPTIAVDSQGHAHITYFRGSNPSYTLYYVTNSVSGIWGTPELISNVNCPGADRVDGGIAVDGSGNPYVVYVTHDGNDYEIEMRYNDGTLTNKPYGGWSTQIITDNTAFDSYPSIAIDQDDKVHIAYNSYSTDFLKAEEIIYATNAGGSWVQATIVSEDYDDKYPSIMVDGNGKIHIAYYHWEMSGGSIRYVTNLGGTWLTNTVASDSSAFYAYPSIALDHQNKVHIAFQTFSLQHFASHATNASGAWITTDMTVTSSDEMFGGMDRQIVIDKDGFVHLFHHGDGDGDHEIFHAKSDQSFGGVGTCSTPRPIACGETVTGNTTTLQNNISSYGCSAWDESGPEEILTFSLAAGENYSVTAKLLGYSANLDVFLLDPSECSSGTCVGADTDGDYEAHAKSLPGGNTYLIAIDGRDGVSGSYTMSLNCEISTQKDVFLPLLLK